MFFSFFRSKIPKSIVDTEVSLRTLDKLPGFDEPQDNSPTTDRQTSPPSPAATTVGLYNYVTCVPYQ